MDVQQEFLSVGVNRVTNALAWSDDNTVAYGAHHMVALYDPKAAKVVSTMLGHTGMVNCVAWVQPAIACHLPNNHRLLISGSADTELRVWAVRDGGRAAAPWQQLAILKGHTGPVTDITVHALPPSPTTPQGSFLVVSTAGDAQLHVWQCNPNPSTDTHDACQAYAQECWQCIQTLPVGTQMQHAVALTHLPGHPDWLVLSTGGTDARLHVYVRPPGGSFSAALKIPGHEGWIRSLACQHVTASHVAGATHELLIASASQDRYARIWRLGVAGTGISSQTPDGGDNDMAAIMRYAPQPIFDAANTKFSVVLESLLIGHEDWVHSVCWQPINSTSGNSPQGPQGDAVMDRQSCRLLSASMDRTMMLWMHEARSGLWMSICSIGDAGASCLGYFGGVFNTTGTAVMAHGFTGAMHLWELQNREAGAAASQQQPTSNAVTRTTSWQPCHALGGHWDAVRQVAWGFDGSCVISVSDDQTSRIFTATRSTQDEHHWCEIARPQVHGHDFSCVAPLPNGTQAASYAYVSGSEEKVLRVMECTQTFLESLRLLKHASSSEAGTKARAYGAAVSALGLTNKLVLEDEASTKVGGGTSQEGIPGLTAYEEGPDFVPNAIPSVISEPPLEEHLAQNTLWLETNKLYGHGDSLYCCAASPDGTYLASACVAKTESIAAIWIWDVAGGTWKGLLQLQGHTLTVTQLAWSHDSNFLAACSRDRTFTIFKRVRGQDAGETFQLVHKQKAAHSRILWGISWSHDDTLLATGARDNLVKIWAVNRPADDSNSNTEAPPVAPKLLCTLPAFASAVTAVAWAPRARVGSMQGDPGYLLAVGLESGNIQMWELNASTATANLVWESGKYSSCAAQVNSLCWRDSKVEDEHLELACASDDHSVRMFTVKLTA